MAVNLPVNLDRPVVKHQRVSLDDEGEKIINGLREDIKEYAEDNSINLSFEASRDAGRIKKVQFRERDSLQDYIPGRNRKPLYGLVAYHEAPPGGEISVFIQNVEDRTGWVELVERHLTE